MFAWDLFDQVLSECDHTDITEQEWFMIVISRAHYSWEKFHSIYPVVPDGICPKWEIFCHSLSYAALEGFSDKLWEDEEEVQLGVRSPEGYHDILVHSSGNDKFIRILVNEDSFQNFMVENIDKIPFERLPVKTVDALLSSERIQDLLREAFSSYDPVELLSHYLVDVSAPFGKTFLFCFPIEIDPENVSAWIDDLIGNYNGVNLVYFCEKFWSGFDKSHKQSVIKYFISGHPSLPFLQLLNDEKSYKFKLSNLISDKGTNRIAAIELVSFCDCIEVDILPDYFRFSVSENLVSILKESRKIVKGFSGRLSQHTFDPCS